MRFENKHFVKESIAVDGNTYVDCRMTDCEIVFGGGVFSMERIVTDGKTSVAFEGEGARLLHMLNVMLNIVGTKDFAPMLDKLMQEARKVAPKVSKFGGDTK